MARPKKCGTVLASIDDCTRTMAELLRAITDIETLIAERDQAVAAASARFEPYLDDARARRIEAELALKNYYYAHLSEIERGGVKHVELATGVMGRRDNPPKLALKNRSWTWGAVLVLLREKFGDRFLRARDPEIDRERVKAELRPEQLGEMGMKLDRDETFYAEPARLPAEASK